MVKTITFNKQTEEKINEIKKVTGILNDPDIIRFSIAIAHDFLINKKTANEISKNII